MIKWNISAGEASQLVSKLPACYRTQVAHAYTSFFTGLYCKSDEPIPYTHNNFLRIDFYSVLYLHLVLPSNLFP